MLINMFTTDLYRDITGSDYGSWQFRWQAIFQTTDDISTAYVHITRTIGHDFDPVLLLSLPHTQTPI